MYFSVIVLTYRRFNNLENNLVSIFNQTFTDYEIIVSDDGSREFEKNKIINLIKKYDFKGNLKIIANKNNTGTVKNYNNAIKNAEGKYIIPLSQDDTFYDKFVLNDLKNFLEKNKSLIFTSLREGKLSQRIFPNHEDIKLLKENDNQLISKRLLVSNFISGSVLGISKKLWNESNGFDECFYLLEDYPFIMKCVHNKIRIDFFDRITIIYGEEGGTSSVEHVSKILKNDIELNYRKYIEPNLNILNSKWNQKYAKYNFSRTKYGNNWLSRYLNKIKYLNILIKLKLIRTKSKRTNIDSSEAIVKYIMSLEREEKTLKCK